MLGINFSRSVLFYYRDNLDLEFFSRIHYSSIIVNEVKQQVIIKALDIKNIILGTRKKRYELNKIRIA